MTTLEKVCDECRKTFTAIGTPANVNRRKYCSRSCAADSYKLKEPFETKMRRVLGERSAPQTNGCILYTGQSNGEYGQIEYARKTYLVHRVAYALTHGAIPDGALVCHECDTPLCINPDHLWLGTYQDNNDDMMDKGRHRTNPNKKLSDAALLQLRNEPNDTPQNELAKKYGVSPSYISMLRNGIRRN